MKENTEETSPRPMSDIPGVNAALSGIQEMLERQWPQVKEVGLDNEKKETGDEFQAVADDPNQEKFNL